MPVRQRRLRPDEHAVFLNVPYDVAYEPLFIALVAAIVSLGRKPRCTLELPDLGQGRPDRIFDLLENCRVSLHDLSRAGVPARFNMVFELGLAFALRRYHGPHDFVILDAQARRLGRTLSDLKNIDPLAHGNSPRLLISGLLDTLATSGRDPRPDDVYRLTRQLVRVATRLKQEYRRDTVFFRAVFVRLVEAANELAEKMIRVPSQRPISNRGSGATRAPRGPSRG